ncbi:MAG TPA: saccharopine dehydrogenase NADP-binding domain-containing protein [Myxococcota bacterium]|nr:saccharopine dehydrogenase NADP-binding domain-containing protein [Myxococcota bacterium]
MASIESVLVIGAGGTLGRRVRRLLAEGLPGVRVIAASRRGPAALGADARAVDVRDGVSLAHALRGVGLVVNAVGPYRYDPTPLVAACIGARAHCLDLAEDPAYFAALRDAADRGNAASAGVAFVPGCSTSPGLVELLAESFAALPNVAVVDAWLSVGSRNAASAALVAGLLRPLGRPRPDGGRWYDTVLWRRVDGRSLAFGRYPSGLPSERVRVGDWLLPLRFHAGFDRPVFARGLRAAAPVLARLGEGAITAVARAAAPLARLAAPLGGARGALRVEALDAEGGVVGEVEVVAVSNGLDVPAAPPLWAARALAAQPRGGVLRLADLVTRAEALAGLAALRCAVSERVHSTA